MQSFAKSCAIVTNREVPGVGGFDIAAHFLLKLIVSESGLEHREAAGERLDETRAISPHVGIETWFEILVLGIVELRFDAPTVPQDAILEGLLQFAQPHQAAASMAVVKVCASANSSSSSLSGGMFASRSIMVLTGPNRLQALRYRVHTAFAIGESCVSTMKASCRSCPAR